MTLRLPLAALLLLFTSRTFAAPCGTLHDPADLGIDLSEQAHCDPLVPERCLLPFPNDYYTAPDGFSRTGRRVAFTPEGMPKNMAGTPLDTVELNRHDGFSPGSALLMWMPTVDLVRSAVPSLTDLGASLGPDSPVVVVDTRNGRRWPV